MDQEMGPPPADMRDWLHWMQRRVATKLPDFSAASLTDAAQELSSIADLLAALARIPQELWPAGPTPSRARPATALPQQRGHRMVRRLRGGYLDDIGVTVPEAVVRKLALAHGDRVRIEAVGVMPGGKRKYRFALAERGTDTGLDRRERVELEYGIVEDGPRPGALEVARTVERALDHPIVLAAEDVQYLGIQSGAIVDLAYWADEPDIVRVSWVHRTHDDDSSDTNGHATLPRRIGSAVDPDDAEDDQNEPDDLPPGVLAGKRVLVVGCEPKRREYEAAIRRLGGEMEWVEGTEGHSRLEAAIRRVDGVVLLTRFIRHQSFWDATALAKGHGVKVVACPKLGIRSVSRAAVELVGAAPLYS
jgi:hypothetical protein